MLVPMHLSRVIVSDINDQRAIYLKEVDGIRVFPILIGDFEAAVINRRLLEEPSYRPMTHDLIEHLIKELDYELEQIVINELRESTFYARLILRRNGNVVEVDSRPSDAIAIGAGTAIPIYVDETVLDQVC